MVVAPKLFGKTVLLHGLIGHAEIRSHFHERILWDLTSHTPTNDEEFWATDAGKAFLAIHSAAIVRRVDLERIFIIERSREDELKPVFAIQKRIGISARVVFKDQLSRHAESVQDFVIYDDQYVRFAKLKDHPTNAIDKVATLSKNPATIERFSNHYRVLHSHSHPV